MFEIIGSKLNYSQSMHVLSRTCSCMRKLGQLVIIYEETWAAFCKLLG